MTLIKRYALGMLILMMVPSLCLGSTVVLEGKHQVVLDIINPSGVRFIPDYNNASFRQKVIEKRAYSARVEITIDLAPFHSDTPFPIPDSSLSEKFKPFLKGEEGIQSEAPEIKGLARKLTADASNEIMAFESVSRWVADNVRYEIDTPQDALSVLNKRMGSCAGQSQLLIGLLRASGIPARYVSGFLPPGGQWGFDKQYWGVTIKSGGYHAWVEVYFPDQGWVFSDILHSLYFVDPYHLLFQIHGTDLNPAYETNFLGAGGNIELETGTSFTIFKENNQSEIVDSLNAPERLILSRRTAPQTSCAIFGSAYAPAGKPVTKGQFIFWEGDRGKCYPLNKNGRFAYAGFGIGTYSFSVQAEGYTEAKKTVTFTSLEAKEVNFQMEPGGEIHGKVVDQQGRPIAQATVYAWIGGHASGYPTDANGNYRFPGLKPDKYTFTVELDGVPKEKAEIEIKAGDKIEKNWALKP